MNLQTPNPPPHSGAYGRDQPQRGLQERKREGKTVGGSVVAMLYHGHSHDNPSNQPSIHPSLPIITLLLIARARRSHINCSYTCLPAEFAIYCELTTNYTALRRNFPIYCNSYLQIHMGSYQYETPSTHSAPQKSQFTFTHTIYTYNFLPTTRTKLCHGD